MAIPEGTFDAINAGNVKAVGEAVTQAIIMGTQNAVAHQNRVNVIAEGALAQQVKNLGELDPTEAASVRGVVSGDLARTMAELNAAVAAIQQLLKGAQTTPPVTP